MYRRPIWAAKALWIRESGKDRGTGRPLASDLPVAFLAHRGIYIAPHACFLIQPYHRVLPYCLELSFCPDRFAEGRLVTASRRLCSLF